MVQSAELTELTEDIIYIYISTFTHLLFQAMLHLPHNSDGTLCVFSKKYYYTFKYQFYAQLYKLYILLPPLNTPKLRFLNIPLILSLLFLFHRDSKKRKKSSKHLIDKY